MRHRNWAAVWVALSAASWAAAGPTLAERLESRLAEVSVQEQPLGDVVDFLSDLTRTNIVVRWRVLETAGIDRDTPVSLRVRNVRFSQFLWLLMHEAGGGEVELAYRAEGDLIVLSTAADLGREMLTRVYDVTDLLPRIARFRGAPRIEIAATTGSAGGPIFDGGDEDGGEGDEDASVDAARMKELTDLIRTTVEPESWVEAGGSGTIAVFDRWIVVRNNLTVHTALGGCP